MKKTLNGIKPTKQEGYELCWAACLEMVLHYFYPEKDIKQREIVAKMYGLDNSNDVLDVQTQKYKPMYNKAATADEIINLTYAFECQIEKKTDETSFWDTIKTEITENRPLIANIGFHYVVIWGFSEELEGNYFIYNDPKKDTYSTKKIRNNGQITIQDELLTVTRTSVREVSE
jgi:hypothetical protein